MFHKAIGLKFLDGTALAVTFQDDAVKKYDMRAPFPKYPRLKALEDRELFLSGKLMGAYGIYWNDDLDIEAETIYEDGETIRTENISIQHASSHAVASARALAGISQKQHGKVHTVCQALEKEKAGAGRPAARHLGHQPRDAQTGQSEGIQQKQSTEVEG